MHGSGSWRWRAPLGGGTLLPWLSLCALRFLAPAAGPGQVPHDMVDAASCLVRGAQQRLGERAGGPVLNRPLTNLCIFFHSLFLSPILLLPEQISSSPPLPFPYSFLHPQPVIPSPAPSLPTAPRGLRFLDSEKKEGRRRIRLLGHPDKLPSHIRNHGRTLRCVLSLVPSLSAVLAVQEP